jgi:hypothetical protein
MRIRIRFRIPNTNCKLILRFETGQQDTAIVSAAAASGGTEGSTAPGASAGGPEWISDGGQEWISDGGPEWISDRARRSASAWQFSLHEQAQVKRMKRMISHLTPTGP